MSAVSESGTTTIAEISCQYALPREGGDRPPLRSRLEQVLESRLSASLARELAQLDSVDRGAVWVVRTLRADAVVSATTDDLDRLASQWGAQLAQSIVSVIQAGPGGEVVRFGSRAQFLAAFAVALATRRADTWVFDALAGLRLLSPAAAIRTGAPSAGARVAEVLTEVIARRGLETLLAASTEREASALWEDCVAYARSAGKPSSSLVAEVRQTAAQQLSADRLVVDPSVLALRLLGILAPELGARPSLLAAIDTAVSDTASPDDRAGTVAPTVAAPDADPSPAPASSDDAAPHPPAEPGTARETSAVDGRLFAALGAPAFLLLPAVERVGLGRLPCTVRAAVLACALRCGRDDAVLLAAGKADDAAESGGGEEEATDSLALLQALRRALVADQRVDGRCLSTERVAHPDGEREVAIVRDAGSDLWLAAALLGAGDPAPWSRLLDTTVADLGQPPQAITGAWEEAGLAPVPEHPAAPTPSRSPVTDLAWIAPGDDWELAVGLAARAVLRDLARRLLGFGSSSMAYLTARFLPLGGIVTETRERILVDLPRAELAVILTMAGLDSVSVRVPWLEPEIIVTHRGN
jgi:hypothetical protein